jgi:hypothetical protein
MAENQVCRTCDGLEMELIHKDDRVKVRVEKEEEE